MALWCCTATPPTRSVGTLTITPLKLDTGASAGAPDTRNGRIKTVTNRVGQNPERMGGGSTIEDPALTEQHHRRTNATTYMTG